MTDNSSATLAPPPEAAGASDWRQKYWKLHGRSRRVLRNIGLWRRLGVLRRKALAARRYEPGCTTLDGFDVAYDDLLSLYMEYKHIFAWGIYDFSPSCERPLVLDCGSHIGVSVMRFKHIAPGCRVVAFEPEPEILRLLRRNMRENQIEDVEIVPAALASSRGTGRFVADGADGGALALDGYVPPAAREVATVPLSEYLDEPVDLLKMNIEGAELDVLREAAPLLHNVRQLVVEYHGFPECGQRLHELLGLLDECGFRYLVHHFDYETNGAASPPFAMNEGTRFFQLVAATRLWERRGAAPRATSRQPQETVSETVPEPVSRRFGFDRGLPVDRHYIEDFLNTWRADIAGDVLEIGANTYTRKFGGPQVRRGDVLHVQETEHATVVADLTRADNIADASYDCFVMTQTLPFIFDVQAALRNTHRILKPGGVLLLTVPGISQLSRYDEQRWGDYWRFTPQSVRRLLEEHFNAAEVQLTVYGNVRAAQAVLDGRAAHELRPIDLSHVDGEYPVIIAARAVRQEHP